MRFISNGDFLLPLHFPTYLAQHIYIWSYERGAANPDGILRLPGRLIDILVFALSGNVAFGYFYLVSCLAISFAAFWWFAKHFLEVERKGTLLIGSLLFACNPIFLGNVSKVGLILAASMLPIALTALKRGFAERRMSYFLLYIAALNVSLLHPFTFAVNLLVSGAYLVAVARTQQLFLRDNIWKFVLLIVVTPLLYAYCLLPLGSMGTLDKSALSDSVASTPVDYTSLVDIANTGDIFTGLSLSKGVLKDYEFYGPMTWPFYFLGVFLLYALLFGMYVQVERRAKPQERRRFVLALGLFLGLLVMATASYLQADVLIKFLIGLPGGWMFRSPLKWQLYIPLALFMALVIAMKYVQKGWRLRLLYAGLACSFVLMNAYLFRQIYQRLLTPRQVSHFSELQAMDVANKNILFADSGACMSFARDNPKIATELNQVLISKPVQVKHVQAANIDTVNLSQYDYVMGCSNTFDQTLLTNQYVYKLDRTFVDNVYALYKNTRALPYVGASAHLFSLDQAKALGGKQNLANTLMLPFQFVTKEQSQTTATGLQDIYDDLSPASIGFGRNWLKNWSFSEEVRANIELADTIKTTIGGYYFKQKSVYDSLQDIRYVPVYPLQFRQPDPTRAQAKAVFAHLSWEPVHNLTFSGGVRYTSESKDQTYFRLNYDGTINRFLDPVGVAYGAGYSGPDTKDVNFNGNKTETVTALSGLTAHYAAKRWDWRVAVDYRLSDQLLVYGTVSTGFKGGGTNPRPFNAAQVIAFKPEKLTAYEIGFKSDLFDRKVRFNMSGFINDYTDIQIPVLSCPTSPCAARLNAGDAKVKGFEAELTAYPVQGLAIDASVSYLNFHFVGSSLNPAAAYPTNPGGVSPNDPPTSPPWKYSAGIQYKADLGSAGSLTPRFDITYEDKKFAGGSVVAGTRVLNFVPSYTLANARLTWANSDDDLNVSLEVTNLFNRYYFLSAFDLRGAGAGFRKGLPGRPREWSLTVKKKF